MATLYQTRRQRQILPPIADLDRDAAALARAMPNAELLDGAAVLAAHLVDLDPESRAVAAALPWPTAVTAEVERRRRYASAGGYPPPDDQRFRAWVDVASQVRDRMDVADLATSLGQRLVRRGQNWCGPCPACGGVDRWVVWPGPPGRAWCRRCATGGDAIGVHRLLTGSGWYEAVRALAADAGVPVPPEPPLGSRPRLRVKEVRRA